MDQQAELVELVNQLKQDIKHEKNKLISTDIVINNLSELELKTAILIGKAHYLYQLENQYPKLLNQKKRKKKTNNLKLVAYVDGSFNYHKNIYGSGIVILHDNKIIEQLAYPGNKATFIGSKALAGELITTIRALEWAEKNKIKKIICYDCKSIKCLALDPKNAKKSIEISYVSKLKKLQKDIDIQFKKIQAHSNNKYNDMANNLAYNIINTKSRRKKI